uniref:Uncharacterized protein n=1 Tax=Rhizophora mucronata TaxID=61149 RepID=A0A2P2Q6I7_RHIMU
MISCSFGMKIASFTVFHPQIMDKFFFFLLFLCFQSRHQSTFSFISLFVEVLMS